MTQRLHIITGPTAVGKTAFALNYAEQIGAEIVSCDASLFYRGMDIGTAKPSTEERERVPHHLIDLCEVAEPYDIVNYVAAAETAVHDILSRGCSVVVTGGSGFYLKSFFAPVIDDLEIPDSIRASVQGLREDGGADALLRHLRAISPDTGRLDILNPRRVERALERCLASGKTVPELEAAFASRPVPYRDFAKELILLEREPADLRERVYQRAAQMLEHGLLAEVRSLLDRGIERNPSAASAIGYRETIACLKGELPETDLLSTIAHNTMKLVRKQRTWFRTQLPTPCQRIVF